MWRRSEISLDISADDAVRTPLWLTPPLPTRPADGPAQIPLAGLLAIAQLAVTFGPTILQLKAPVE